MEMTKYKLGDVCAFINGRAYSQPELLDSGKYKVLRVGNIFDGNHWYYSDMELEEDKYCNEGDLLYSWACTFGPYIWHGPKTIYHYHIWKVKQNDSLVDKSFLYYFLNHQTKGFMGSTHGSTMIHITKENMENFEVLLPSLKEQKKIASVLSALDDKIALNKKMNQKLEAMAKRLYDYWFVQYDFPDKNGLPYKTAGGPMTYNPTLKREIPEGWEVDVVGNVCESVLGGTPSTENENFWNGNIPWLNSGEVAEFPILNAEKRITEDAVKNSATAYLPAGSVTLSITRHLRPSIMAIDACINQSVAGIKENDILKNGYLYPYLVNEIPRLNTLRGGAQQPHINKDTVDKSPIVIPAQNVLHQYYEKVNPLYREIIEKAKESQKLTTLRDKLLPLLMNGQVEVD